MIHLLKLAVGVRDVGHLAAIQAERANVLPPLRHRTRHRPKLAAEICDGGSIFWVINRVVSVRQRVVDIMEDHWEDGSRCAGLVLDAALVAVAPRPMKPFQGWRYLKAEDAPADRAARTDADDLPAEMRLALVRLALL